MSMWQQIAFGTCLLTVCALIHIAVVALSVPGFSKLARMLHPKRRRKLRVVVFLCFAVLVLVFAHTVQVWLWAASFLRMTELPDLPTSFYFATVTYTTLGYGDLVLSETARIAATFCAITGLLTFGISTAFLFGVLARVLPGVFGEQV